MPGLDSVTALVRKHCGELQFRTAADDEETWPPPRGSVSPPGDVA